MLEAHIARDPFFLSTFDPYTPDSNEQIILRMAHATRKAGVGPMAAVAGAIAWAGVEAMVDAGAVFGVIDNGGDIALLSDRPVRSESMPVRQFFPTRLPLLSLRRRKYWVYAPHRQRLDLPSPLVVQMLLRYSLLMLRLPMPGLHRSATRSVPMTRRFSTG